jgi:serine/threonine protein kinase/TolB-like protein/Tfp pilus assembly protein PilF
MTPERWQQVKGVLQNVLERTPLERAAFLDQACDGDQALRQEVESLLATRNEGRSSFLQSPPTTHLSKGTRVGDYEIQSLLGTGGMGEVYRARDLRLRRDVAIKVLPSFVSSDPERLRRFEQEATAAAALNHPNILAVYQMGTHESAPYLVSELLEGETLREQIKRGRLAVRKAIDYAVQIARGLAAAHEKGIVHRDLKPENSFVTKDGRVKILDFGLAKLMKPLPGSEHSAPTLGGKTEPGTVMGTVGYMAPEQVRGQATDHRADLFAFGAILYEMLSGKRAFQKPTSPETMTAILNEDPPGISQLVSNLPPALQRVVNRCLEKNPEQRFQSASDLAFALESISGSWASVQLSAELRATGSREVRRTADASDKSRSRLRALAATVGGLVVLLALIAGFRAAKLREWLHGSLAAPHIESLAVLPLKNLSGDPAQEYFADGMTEELTADLSKVGAVRVISRTSAMRYKDANKSLPEIARELNVDGVVEGSVERAGDRVRITAQLIQAPTDTHLWANSYERDMRNILSLQDEVARDIASEIKVTLTPLERAQLSSSRPIDPQAYEAYLRGRHYYNKLSIDGFNEGLKYFQQAVNRDPNYALAYVGLADCYKELGIWGDLPPRESSAKAKAAIQKALAIDNNLGEAHATLAHLHFVYDWDWAGAQTEFNHALELSPGSSDVHLRYAIYLSAMGKPDEAVAEIEKAHALDPVSQPTNTIWGFVYLLVRRCDKAIEQLQKTLALYPDSAVDHNNLGICYEHKSMDGEAVEEYLKSEEIGGATKKDLAMRHRAFLKAGLRGFLQEELKSDIAELNHGYVAPFDFAQLYARLGDKDRAFENLEKTYKEGGHNIAFLKVEPGLDNLRSDPRFTDLLRRVGLRQ